MYNSVAIELICHMPASLAMQHLQSAMPCNCGLVHPQDLSNHVFIDSVGVKCLADGLEAGKVLRIWSALQVSLCIECAHAWIQVLGGVAEHLSCVLGPVRPARELVDQCRGKVAVYILSATQSGS